MTLRPDILAAILVMAIVTYACRAGGYAALRAARLPPFADAMIRHLPGPLFAAYVALALSRQDVSAGVAAVAVVVVQKALGSIGFSILAGVGVMALLRNLGW
ncbi:AzlD family protein [Roseomonas sp. CCTCC AB2023176]|uniref:AzlD family protein n=1 Tax=Roseomonas sp. CCTCC AB2023176 TaxID=3342640 RepID=UPI0035D6B180